MDINTIFKNKMKETDHWILSFPWENESFYCHWLKQTYSYVNYSTRLILLAGAHFKHDKENFHRRFMDYVREEKGHERLAENDLKFFNKTVADFTEFNSTKSFYQNQYYWIQNHSPMAFFGYILALEGIAVTSAAKIYKRVNEQFGKSATSFLKVHIEEDIGHVEQAFKLLKDINKYEQDLIHENLNQSLGTYQNMLENCAAAKSFNLQKSA